MLGCITHVHIVVCFVLTGSIQGARLSEIIGSANRNSDIPDARAVVLPGTQTNYLSTSNCQWQVNSNPCINNINQALNFPHPTDSSKFLQCGANNRLFIIQCPTNEQYDQATSTCVHRQLIVSQPVYGVTNVGLADPCIIQTSPTNTLYYPVARDVSKFIQCTGQAQVQGQIQGQGQSVLLTCPASMVWDSRIQACVYSTQAGVVVANNALGTAAGTPGLLATTNPCTVQAIAANALYFSHPDPHKFIQCDNHGNAFVQQCPSGLVWNESLLTCAAGISAYTSVTQQQRPVQPIIYSGQIYAGSTLFNNTLPYRIY